MSRYSKNRRYVTGHSRREFLQRLGAVGGVSAVYQAMVTMGLLVPGDARAIESRKRWLEGVSRLTIEDKPMVAILGGGIAGLCVAYELKKAGFPFFLVEARDRPGGRNHTVRTGSEITETDSIQTCTFDPGEELYFNAGPARISHHHSNLLSYCRELDVVLEPFINDNRAAYIHSASAFAGQPVPVKQVIASMRGAICSPSVSSATSWRKASTSVGSSPLSRVAKLWFWMSSGLSRTGASRPGGGR